jgi:hypothetical protein
MSCLHKNFKVEARVARLIETEDSDSPNAYTMDLEVHCADCMRPFLFKGMSMGVHPSIPTTNFDKTEARIPIEPA